MEGHSAVVGRWSSLGLDGVNFFICGSADCVRCLRYGSEQWLPSARWRSSATDQLCQRPPTEAARNTGEGMAFLYECSNSGRRHENIDSSNSAVCGAGDDGWYSFALIKLLPESW